MSMHIYYDLTLIIDRLVGGIPKQEKIIKGWQEARWPTGLVAEELANEGITPETATEQTLEDLGSNAQSEDEIAAVWTGFAMMQHPQFGEIAAVESRQIKAMLKESANIIKDMPEAKVEKKGKDGKVTRTTIALRAKLAERVFPQPKWIPILDVFGEPIKIDNLERPIHVMTRQGPRTALKRTDFADEVILKCELKVLNDGLITENILRAILNHACDNGIGTDRSQGAGTFAYELKLKKDDDESE